MALGLFALGWRYTPLPHAVAALRADHHTSTGQRQRLVLADGSRVWLNTRSALDVDYRRQEPVSYTHLDVYKRQLYDQAARAATSL